MLDGLMGGAVLPETDGVMAHHIDGPLPHQRGQPQRWTAIVHEDQERAAVGDHAAMQGHTIHHAGHDMLADTIIEIVAGEISRADRLV